MLYENKISKIIIHVISSRLIGLLSVCCWRDGERKKWLHLPHSAFSRKSIDSVVFRTLSSEMIHVLYHDIHDATEWLIRHSKRKFLFRPKIERNENDFCGFSSFPTSTKCPIKLDRETRTRDKYANFILLNLIYSLLNSSHSHVNSVGVPSHQTFCNHFECHTTTVDDVRNGEK